MSKNVSERTKDVKGIRNLLGFISYFLLIGTFVFIVVSVLKEMKSPNEIFEQIDAIVQTSPVSAIFQEEVIRNTLGMLFGILIATVLVILGLFLIKDKPRTFMWMISLLLGVIAGSLGFLPVELSSNIIVYIVFGIWFADEYIIHPLYNKYKNLAMINKEIDRRGIN